MDYKKGEESWGFSRDAAACCCLEAGSGNWIMADFRDGKATMENFLVHPGLGLQEDRTKKGRNSANGQWTMDGDPAPRIAGYLGQEGENDY